MSEISCRCGGVGLVPSPVSPAWLVVLHQSLSCRGASNALGRLGTSVKTPINGRTRSLTPSDSGTGPAPPADLAVAPAARFEGLDSGLAL